MTSGTVRAHNYERRREFARYLRGEGIEIGALHNPLDLSAAPDARVRYVDRFPVAELREHYPELDGYALTVDIVDDGQTLATIADGSQDFIVANSMIEHCDNPLGTLERWLAKLKPGGIVYLTVPDKRVGWDERRPVTSIAHLVEDYRLDDAARRARNVAHYEEFFDLITSDIPWEFPPFVRGLSREEALEKSIAMEYSIHYHVFTHESFLALLAHARDMLGFPLAVVAAAGPVPESWECIVILRKTMAGEAATEPAIVEDPMDLEEARIALAKASIRIGYLEGKRWEAEHGLWQANTELWETKRRIWELETRCWEAETGRWKAETALWNLTQGATAPDALPDHWGDDAGENGQE